MTVPRLPLNSFPKCYAFGHSFTKGLYASAESTTWRERLWTLMQTGFPGSATTKQFSGTSGGKVGEAYARAQTDVLPNSPDLIVVQFHTNDVTGGSGSPTSDDTFRRQTADLMDLLTDSGRSPRLVVWQNNVWCNWGSGDVYWNRAVTFNTIMSEEASRRGIPVADIWSDCAGKTSYLSTPSDVSAFPPGYAGDNFHYGDVGHDAIATVVFAAIQTAIANRQRRTASGRVAASTRAQATGRQNV